jgi:hypothetical protein
MSDETSSPFEQPGLMTGYPLQKDEERELEDALRRIEDERQEGHNGHQPTATRATPASAS